jgi:glycosyltransferase involved in cell wall biosynthesis
VRPRVLFVSKPIAAPFHDGTKCLVRDVARHLTECEPIVMSSPGAVPLQAAPACVPIRSLPVYRGSGRFAPGLAQNLRAASFLALSSRADVWHFVFAPNPATSAAGRLLSRARRVPVVQTVASPPRSFDGIERLLFGQIVVVQSRWTRERIVEAAGDDGRIGRLELIPPPVPDLVPPAPEAVGALRRQLGISERAPIFVYPGDIELSGGAEAVARVVSPVARELPDAIFVFAYRPKTDRAEPVARALARRLDPSRVRFASALSDVLVLIATASAVLFPVDDLWGKVDLPIVLLESMALGIPVIALEHGPLCDLEGAVLVPRGDDRALISAALELWRNPERRGQVIAAGRSAVERRHRAEVVARAYERLYLEMAR